MSFSSLSKLYWHCFLLILKLNWFLFWKYDMNKNILVCYSHLFTFVMTGSGGLGVGLRRVVGLITHMLLTKVPGYPSHVPGTIEVTWLELCTRGH